MGLERKVYRDQYIWECKDCHWRFFKPNDDGCPECGSLNVAQDSPFTNGDLGVINGIKPPQAGDLPAKNKLLPLPFDLSRFTYFITPKYFKIRKIIIITPANTNFATQLSGMSFGVSHFSTCYPSE